MSYRFFHSVVVITNTAGRAFDISEFPLSPCPMTCNWLYKLHDVAHLVLAPF